MTGETEVEGGEDGKRSRFVYLPETAIAELDSPYARFVKELKNSAIYLVTA